MVEGTRNNKAQGEGHLTVVCGNAGTGKTTYGRALARQSGMVLIDIDTVSERLVRAGLRALKMDPDDRDSPDYKSIYREAIHETLFALAEENLPALGCIIVAPFTQERRDSHFLKYLKDRFNCSVAIVYLWCSDEARKARIVARNNARDAGKLRDWAPYAASGRDESRPPFEHVFIDTTASRIPDLG